MRIGIYKGHEVRVYNSGNEFIVQFLNGISFTTTDVSDIDFIINPTINT